MIQLNCILYFLGTRGKLIKLEASLKELPIVRLGSCPIKNKIWQNNWAKLMAKLIYLCNAKP